MNRIEKALAFFDLAVISALVSVIAVGIISSVCGCKAYRNGGTIVTIGEQTVLPEVSDPYSDLSLRIYESIHGARIWSRENTLTTVAYENTYTNSTFGIFTRSDHTVLTVSVQPVASQTDTDPATTHGATALDAP